MKKESALLTLRSYAGLRQTFLEFFAQQGHEVVASSSLVPGNDPSLLFTNAGMVQFKDVFLGQDKRSYQQAVSAQRCIRAGGKHNDLENVGYTARHHTFFEMLGNFSFGAYFKEQAITYAWEFLTGVLGLPPERLWVTVYEQDAEAESIWLDKVKVNPQRFSRCGAQDNFWSMGDTGPCGPCTEIFYDHGPEVEGGPPGSLTADGDRYVEIWNLVFMQYERDAAGELKPLPNPAVDTGMGLERLAAVMQGVTSNYDTDLFQRLIRFTADLAGCSDLQATSLRVIADHIRSTSFLIADGIVPSNEGRGYVLRRIIRRAIRHGQQLGFTDTFFYRLVAPLVQEMGEAYPELANAQAHIERILRQEEEQFAKTLQHGLRILEQDLAKLTGTIIPGSTVFRLYDTYGFPVDLTADIARERHFTLDLVGFEQEMTKQRQLSQQASKFTALAPQQLKLELATQFWGYEHLTYPAEIVGLFKENAAVTELKSGETGVIILDHTPFYAESGGQVGDQGILKTAKASFTVTDTRKAGQTVLHQGQVTAGTTLRLHDRVQAQVDTQTRQATARNHSATHLLHAALRHVLGSHVTQKGSWVEPSRLRFDFGHYEPLTTQQLAEVERLVNQQIRADLPVTIELMTPEQAIAKGALALFGEKYGDTVRVLSMGDFSMELCGGTHVKHTSEIGLIKITSETGIAAGVRRIEAITGDFALTWFQQAEQQLQDISGLLKTHRHQAYDKLQQTLERMRSLEKELAGHQAKLAGLARQNLVGQVVELQGVKVLAAQLPNSDTKVLRDTVDQLKQQLGSAVIVLASVSEQRVNLVAGVTSEHAAKMPAGELVNYVARQVGGKGGGRSDMAQAGGTEPQALSAALQTVVNWVEARR